MGQHDDGICQIISHVFGILGDNPTSRKLKFIFTIRSKRKMYPDAAILDRCQEYPSTAG